MASCVLVNQRHQEILQLPLSFPEERVKLLYGTVRLLRAKCCKNKLFYAPVIPSPFVLLLFPEGVQASNTSMRTNAYNASIEFIEMLQHDSITFHVQEALGCVSTGNLFFLLRCSHAEEALQLIEKAEKCSRDDVRYLWPCSNLYVRALEFVPIDDEQHASVSSLKDAGLSSWKQYYHYPSCLLCAERLDKTLTGYKRLGTMCRCGKRTAQNSIPLSDVGSSIGSSSRNTCSCMLKTSCAICKLLLRTLKQQQGEKMFLEYSDAVSPLNSLENTHLDGNSSSTGIPLAVIADAPRCATCGRGEDPWVCLICGYIGCSRYQAMHAKEHYTASAHYFSINLLTQEVWDYESDSFVHRLIVSVDRNTGSTTQIQFPEREVPGGLSFENVGGASANDSTEGEERAFDGVIVKKETLLEKKCLSTKFDLQSISHTQQAIILKNDLDTSRHLLEATVVLDTASKDAWDCFNTRVSDESASPLKSLKNTSKSQIKTQNMAYFSVFTPRGEEILSDLVKSVESFVRDLKECHCVHDKNMKLDAKIRTMDEEEKELKELYNSEVHDLRQIMEKNILEVTKLDEELDELKTTKNEIRANLSTAATLRQRGYDAAESWSAFAALGPPSTTTSSREKKKKR